jgi:hypothetical protein
MALLQLAQELITLAGDHVHVVVGQLAPLLANLALELLPVSLDTVFIHGIFLSVKSTLTAQRMRKNQHIHIPAARKLTLRKIHDAACRRCGTGPVGPDRPGVPESV